MNQPLISIIIPTKNRLQFLTRAIQSVFKQTYLNWELIIIDDASADDSARHLVEGFSQAKHKITYQKNETSVGGAAARNIGIALAQGDILAFLDDDDEWLPEKLERQIDILKHKPTIGLVGCDYFFIDRHHQKKLVKTPRNINFEALLIENYLGSFSFVMVRKKLLDKYGLLRKDMKSFQDWELWLRLIPHTKIHILAEPLVNYYEHQRQRISASTSNAIESLTKIIKQYKGRMPHLILFKHWLWLRFRQGGLYNLTHSKYLVWPYQLVLRTAYNGITWLLERIYL